MEVGGWTLDPWHSCMRRNGHSMTVPLAELRILRALASHPGQRLTAEQLAHQAGIRTAGSLKVQLCRLRERLFDTNLIIASGSGRGYRLVVGGESDGTSQA